MECLRLGYPYQPPLSHPPKIIPGAIALQDTLLFGLLGGLILTPVSHFPNIFGEAMLQKLFKGSIVTLFDLAHLPMMSMKGNGDVAPVSLCANLTLSFAVINV